MAISLIITTRDYRGLSTDEKPVNTSADEIPAGSTFTETDTGRVWTWLYTGTGTSYTGTNGGRWERLTSTKYFSPDKTRELALLDSIDSRLARLVELLEERAVFA